MPRPTEFESWANTQARHDDDEVVELPTYDRLADRLAREEN